MSFNELWFILIAVLFSGYFFFEGFDFGVGILLPFLGKNDNEKRFMINTIGPVWDSNEVWLLTAGGAIFAAFPGWYATMFSGFYLALFLVLFALIFRGVAFEFRSKVGNTGWRNLWDSGIFLGSLLTPLLVGCALANLIKGVPIDAAKEFTGSLLDLLSVPCLLAGITAVAVFTYHGAVYLSLKLDGGLMEKAYKTAEKTGIAAIILGIATIVAGALTTDIFTKPAAVVLVAASILALAASYVFICRKRNGLSMILNGAAVVTGVFGLFAGLFPRVMVSSTSKDFNLDIYNISSSPYTLKVMAIVALTLVPIVLAYIAWTYWVFRKKLGTKDIEY